VPASDGRLVDVGKIVACLGKKLQQGGTSLKLSRKKSELRDHSGAACLQLRPQIIQNELPRFLVEPKNNSFPEGA
jgi:hypothetical protein